MKKFISLILTICLITSISVFIPLSANAATSGTCGDNLTWTLDDEGTLTISGTGAMEYFYNYSDVPWNDLATSIVKVIISDGITNISDYAFGMCTNLISVSISESVTDIGLETFGKCSKLETIAVASGNKEYSSIDGIVYNKDKTSLWVYPAGKQETMFSIPESVKSIEFAAFEGCPNITNVIIPDSVTYIGNYSFYKCTNLTSVTIPKSVSWIGRGAFSKCSNLKNVYFTDSEQRWDVVFDETKSNGTYIDDENDYLKNATIHYNYSAILVKLNNVDLVFDQPPMIINNRTMVPIRAIFEAMGYVVEWNSETRTATSIKGDDKIVVQLNNNIIKYTVNGKSGEYTCDTVPQIVSGRTLVPARAVSESAGCKVEWNGESQLVSIFTNKEL